MNNKILIIIILTIFALACNCEAYDIDIQKLGAIGDGKTLNTNVIQMAIDSCSKFGGKVTVPAGVFLTGSIHLKTGVELYLSKNAVLLGSTKNTDYEKETSYALILAHGQYNLIISGEGTIDGQGRELAKNIVELWHAGLLKDNVGKNRPDEKYRPEIIDLENCSHVMVKGITIKNSSCWVQTYHKCDNLLIDHITVNSTAYWNNDGIDLVDCHKVRVTNCDINSADDGICLKSDENSDCNSIYVSDCRIRSSANALKFGTSSAGGFHHIKVRNLYIYNTFRSAIAIECVDGGAVSNIDIQNIKAVNTGNAIFIRLGKRNKNRPVGSVENVLIKNIDVTVPCAKPDKGYEIEGPIDNEVYNVLPSSIVGLPGSKIENIKLENIIIRYEGDINIRYHPVDNPIIVPERPANYPEFSMFGELPAWGFYIRHAGNIKLENIKIICNKIDLRAAIFTDDADKIKADKILIGNLSSGTGAVVFHEVNKLANAGTF